MNSASLQRLKHLDLRGHNVRAEARTSSAECIAARAAGSESRSCFRDSGTAECEPCRERGRPGVTAERNVAGTPMCRLCFSGGAGSEVRMEQVPRPQRPANCGGRLPEGWPGGMRVVEATGRLAPGTALRFEVPAAVPVDRARWGIYRAARLRRVRVSILRRGSELTVWRKGSKEQVAEALRENGSG